MIAAFETEDLMAPQVTADPYRYYGELREHDPVHWNPKWQFWVVTRHADVLRLTREHEVFSSDFPPLPEPHAIVPPIDEADWQLAEEFSSKWRTFVRFDRPQHLAMRQVIHRWFTPRSVEKWREKLRVSARELIEERLPDGGMEVKNQFAIWPPLITISLMLDIPIADAEHLHGLTKTLIGFEDTHPDRIRQSAAALNELEEYFNPLIDARAVAGPTEDLISMIAEGEREGTFTRPDSVATVVLLFLAGHDTTTSLISNGFANLIRNPDQWDLLRADPEGLCASTTEECLRYEGSVKGSMRRCVETTAFSGTTIEAGDMVWWVIASANREPRAFAEPDRFDITRSPNPHAGLGGGIHHCLGASLTRVEAQEVFRALVELMPARPQLVDETIEYESHLTMRSPSSLNVSWN
jgi:cytochrome P450